MPKQNISIFDEPMASKLDNLRELARSKRRITYDCFNARVQGNQVYCAKGHQLKRAGFMGLISVLRGRSCLTCQKCPDYEADY